MLNASDEEEELAARAQLVKDGIPLVQAQLMCMEDFGDILADIIMEDS